MTSIKRSLAAAGAAALLSVALTACGGDGDGGGAPTDAAVEDYCNIGDDLDSTFSDLAEDDFEGFVEAAQGAADQLAEVGTPEDIPDDARQGFEAMVDALGSLDAGEVESAAEELKKAAESGEQVDQDQMMVDLYGVNEEDIENVTAFNEYSSETCSS